MRDPIYVVLGAHRGGTSAVSKGMNALGVSLGDNLMPGVPGNNERGFWEDLDIVQHNGELLRAFDDSWHSIRILEESRIDAEAFPHLIAKGRALLALKLQSFTPFGFKDPRTARLLFYWERVFEELKLEPRYVIALRDPISVARSLDRRDGIPAAKSHLLWLEHMLGAMRWTNGRRRVVIDYNRLLADPAAQLERVRKTLHMPRVDARHIAEFKEYLSDELRHFKFDKALLRKDAQLPRLALRLYNLLDRLASDKLSESSAKVLSDIDAMWGEALDFGPVFAFAENKTREIIEWSKVVADREAQIRVRSKGIADREAQIQQMSSTVAARDQEIGEYAKVVAEREAQIRHLGARAAAHEHEIAEYAKIVADREAQIQHFTAVVAERERQIGDYIEVVAERDTQIAELGKNIASRDEEIELLRAGVAEGRRQVAEHAARIDDYVGRIDERDKQLEKLTVELGRRDQAIVDLTGWRDMQIEQIKNLHGELEILRSSLANEQEAAQLARAHSGDLGKQLYSASLRLQHIETSSFWRATSLLRTVWRFFENRVFRRNFIFQLIPNKDLELLRGTYEWRATGHDPFFYMLAVDGSYPSGWALVSSSLQRRAEDYTLKLYYDAGSGMTEQTTRVFPVTESGEVRELTWFPRGIRQMRWDPMQGTGELTQNPIVISHVGLVARSLHRIARVWAIMRSRDSEKLQKIGVTWRRFLSQPQPTYEAASALRNHIPTIGYEALVEAQALTDSDRNDIVVHIESLAVRPLISVLMPVYNTPPNFLRAAIDSVRAQLYPNWELCIADDASPSTEVKDILEEYRQQDPRIKIEYRTTNGHISAASNSALALAEGEFVALLDHDDMLAEQALYQMVVELNRHADTDIVYSDEDKIDENGNRYEPHFKPDWSPDLLYSQNYVSHLGVYRTSLVRAVGGFREGFEGSQDYDLILRCVAAAKNPHIRHVPAILYHWRATTGSTALSRDNKGYATQSGINALEDHFRLRGLDGVSVESGRYPTTYRVRFPLPAEPPKVSLIIPTRDGCDILRACIESIQTKTTYPNYEIVVVDNQSSDERTLRYFEEAQATGVRVLRYADKFNYPAINNFAVQQVDGAVVGLINNDIEVISPEWLTEMVSHALRPEIGAVGAKLYYGNDTIQHAGVILGVGGVAGHSHKYFPREVPGYFARLCLTQNLSAVTAACLLVRRETYLQVGGMDSANLPIAFNDVDFCLRLCEIGLKNVWTPYAELYHHESLSRGAEDSPEKIERFQKEIRYMMERWGELLRHDPYYSPMLNLEREDFRPNYKAPPPKPWLNHNRPMR